MDRILERFAVLYKKASDGGVVVWQIWVESDGDEADIMIEFGREGGKKQLLRERISEGKNLGKSNETTPFRQACLEAKARWTKQRERKGYGLTVDDSAKVRSESPMLAYSYADYYKRIDWENAFAQPKYDGFRCLARIVDGKVILTSRENKLILTMPHIAEELRRILKPGLTFDGELFNAEMTFQAIASAIKKEGDDSPRIGYHVYDCLSEEDYAARYSDLFGLLNDKGYDNVQLVETVIVHSPDDLWLCQQRFLDAGYEGAMLRHGAAGYEAGKRSKSLLKVKVFIDREFKVVDAKEGRGTHIGMAIFTCETDAGNNFDVLSPGTHDDKRRYWKEWRKYIGKMLTVKHFEMTDGEEPVPRFPVAIRFREDA